MASIEIRYFTGDIEQRALSKKQPVSIGRHPSNDVCIDEDDVAPMHCRISWNRNGYEVAAAGQNGVEVNGTLVQHAPLRDDDVIRVGTVDIGIVDAGGEREPAAVASTAGSSGAVESPPQPARRLPDELFEDHAPEPGLVARVIEDEPARQPSSREPRRPAPERIEPEGPDSGPPDQEFQAEPRREQQLQKRSIADRLRRRLGERPARPGEQEIVRSKFLIGLVWFILILALAIGVFWYWTALNAAEKHYNRAVELHEGGKYSEAIDVYTSFLETYPPTNEYVNPAFFGRAKARVDRYVSGASPDWKKAMAALEEFRTENRERDGFSEQTGTLLEYAKQIALGACDTAEKTQNGELLPVAVDARNFAREYKADDDFLRNFEVKRKQAEAEVVRKEAYDEAVAGIESAIRTSDISDALKQRRGFLRRYPDMRPAEARKLDRLLSETMQAEQSLIEHAELNRAGIARDHPSRAKHPLSLTLHVRPPDGRTSDHSQVVLGVAKNCCYGIDAVTGEPLWRRAIGTDTPFFPLKQNVGKPAALVYDNELGEVVLLELRTGRLIWRQPLAGDGDPAERLSGAPLVHQGQIFIPTLSRRLYKLDLASGRIADRLQFSQKLLAPPVATPDNERLIVAGDADLMYTVNLNPKLACESVSYVGHGPGSVRAPLIRIGKLVLMCENDQKDSCRLRVLNTSPNGTWLEELTFPAPKDQVRVTGTVRDKPALRERILYVPSSHFPDPAKRAEKKPAKAGADGAEADDEPREYITAFSVNDDTQRPQSERTKDQFLKRIAELPIEEAHDGPVYLVTGPNDELWMASTRLRKFQLKTRNIQRSTDEDTAPGRASQPPQVIGKQAYLGRQSDYSAAISMTQNDLETMGEGAWRVVLGAGILAWAGADGQPLVCLNEDGQVFRVLPTRLETGGFQLDSSARLRPKNAKQPLRAVALADGRLAVAGGGSEPTVWVVSAQGIVDQRIPIPSPLQADPLPMGDGIVLPLPGRLRYVPLRGGGTVGDYQAPFETGNADKSHWTHLVAVSGTELVAADSQGRLRRIALSTSAGRTYLAQRGDERKLDPPPAYGFAALGRNVVLADARGNVHLINPDTLQPSASAPAGGTVTNAVWTAEGLAFVEVERSRLLCFAPAANGLKRRWELKLSGKSGLAGPPTVVGNRLIVAERDGTLSAVDPATGNARQAGKLHEPVSHAPRLVGTKLIVPSVDGSLHAVIPTP